MKQFISSSFTTPTGGSTTAYTANDLIANASSAPSVTPLSFPVRHPAGKVVRARLHRSSTISSSVSVRLNLYSTSPTASNGHNGAYLTDKSQKWLGAITFDFTSIGNRIPNGTDGLIKAAAPTNDILYSVVGQTPRTSQKLFGLLQANSAFVDSTAGVSYKVTLDIEDDNK